MMIIPLYYRQSDFNTAVLNQDFEFCDANFKSKWSVNKVEHADSAILGIFKENKAMESLNK